MGFSFNDLSTGSEGSGSQGSVILDKIFSAPQAGSHDLQEIFCDVIQLAPEKLLARLLKHPDPEIRAFCARCLWGIWFNERGEEAREELMTGIRAMEDDKLDHALKLFENTLCRYPGWAEALNKLATVQYLLKKPKNSAELCRLVLGIKPHHFGARNGLVHCAIQMKNWELAASALKDYWSLCPHSADAPEFDRIIRENASF